MTVVTTINLAPNRIARYEVSPKGNAKTTGSRQIENRSGKTKKAADNRQPSYFQLSLNYSALPLEPRTLTIL